MRRHMRDERRQRRQSGSMYVLHMETDVCVRHKPHVCVCCSKLNMHGFYNAYEMNTRVNTRDAALIFKADLLQGQQ